MQEQLKDMASSRKEDIEDIPLKSEVNVQEEPSSPSAADPGWYALYVQVKHEKEVAKRLEQKCITAFLPLMETRSKRVDRRKVLQLPLFPGYVFVHAALDSPTHVQILKTPGAVRILSNSDGPLSIPPFQIESLAAMLRVPGALRPHPYLNEGDWVRVVRGVLSGCTGILVRQDTKKGRLVVSLDIIQRSVAVELDIEEVEPLRDRPCRI